MGPAPFPVVLDELAYYANSGLDRMLAMGRGLNISFMLGFQEVSGIWARLGEKTASLLGNANLTIAMRQQDSGRTREWIEKTAGQTYITQATAYHGAADGNCREARHAEVRPVSRVDWNDLTTLIEGEAIVLYGSRRIYARLFHAAIDDAGPKRLGRRLMLRSPDRGDLRQRLGRIGQIAVGIERGAVVAGATEELSPALSALLRGFAELDGLPEELLPGRPPPPADGTPVTSLSPMLSAAGLAVFAGPETAALPHEPVDARLLRGIAAIERAAGVPEQLVQDVALAILAACDGALEAVALVDPPPVTLEEFQRHLNVVMRELEAARDVAGLKRAA